MVQKISNFKKKVVKNSFWLLISSIATKFGGLLFTVILARGLMPEGYGIYSLVMAITMTFYSFADLGIGGVFFRYLSVALSKEKEKVSAYHFYLLKLKFIFSLSASVLLFIAAYPIAVYFFKNINLVIPLVFASVYIFILSFESFYSQVFYAMERTKYIGIKDILSQILRVGLVFLVFYVLSPVYRITGIIVLLTIVSFVMLLYSIYFIYKIIPEIYTKSEEKIDKSGVRKFIFFLTFASLSGMVFAYFDSIILGFFLSPKYIGYYRSAFALVWGVGAFLTFPNNVFLPTFAKSSNEDLKRILNKLVKYYSIWVFPSLFGLAALGNFLIRFFYGYEYLPATLPFYFLITMLPATIFVGLLLNVFSAKNKPRVFAKLAVYSALINGVLDLILIKSLLFISEIWATTGAAIAISISWIFYLFGALYYLNKELDIKLNFVSTIKPIIASIFMLIMVRAFIYYFPSMNILLGILSILVGIITYAGALVLLGGINFKETFLFVKNLNI